MLKVLFSKSAIKDFDEIQDTTWEDYGEDGVIRYTLLIDKTINTIASGVQIFGLNEPIKSYYSYHTRHHKKEVHYKGIKVRKPRHTIFYKIEGSSLLIGRILHEREDFSRHLDDLEYE